MKVEKCWVSDRMTCLLLPLDYHYTSTPPTPVTHHATLPHLRPRPTPTRTVKVVGKATNVRDRFYLSGKKFRRRERTRVAGVVPKQVSRSSRRTEKVRSVLSRRKFFAKIGPGCVFSKTKNSLTFGN